MIQKESRFWTVTAQLVMIVVLLISFSAGVKAQVTIMRYLQSKQAFQDSITAGAIQIKHGNSDGSSSAGTVVQSSSLCYWDDTKDALRVTGGSQNGQNVNVANPNGIALTTSGAHGPFKLVDTSTGFTLSMEAWINRSSSSSDMARFFDATKYLSGNEGNINKRSHLFGFKPLSEICFYEWTDGSTPKYSGIISDTSLGQDGKWANYLILVSSTGNVKVYIDGHLKHDRSDIVNAVKSVLGSIKGFNLTIGNAPSWEKNKQLDGWIRNVQIVSTTNLKQVTISGQSTTTDWTKTFLANSVNASSGPLTVVGSDVNLTPYEGYHIDWSKVTLPSSVAWSDSNNPGSFVMPNNDVAITLQSGAISMKQFGVHYDANNGTGAPDNSSSVNYWTNTTANTLNTLSLSSTTPTREGYSFAGWNTKQDGTGNNFLASASVNAQQLGVTGNSQQNVVTLYAQWTKIDYTVTTASFVVQDYNGNTISTPSGLLLGLQRALEATPETFAAILSGGTAQINDKIQVTNTSTNQDYFLYSLTYTPVGGSASGDIKDNPTFTMPAANVTITATFRKYQEFDLTAAGVSGTGNAISFLVKHRDSEFTASTKAMQTDQVKVHATVGSGFVLRTVTYQFDGVDGTTNIYNGKGTGTFDIPTTFVMSTHPATVTATFLENRTVSVGGHSERGRITMTGKYGTSSSDVITAATAANTSLTANSGDLVTVTAACGTGWHFEGTDAAAIISAKNGETALTTTSVSVSDGTQATATFNMVDANVSVAAAYKENTYTIAYDLKGGSGTFANQTKSHFVSLQLHTATPTLASSTFMGWATSEADATNKVVAYAPGAIAGEELNGTAHGTTVTLYAVWKSKEYTVSVDPGINGGTISVDKTTVTAQSPEVTIQYNAYEGYSTQPTLYYYTATEVKTALAGGTVLNKTAHTIDGSSFSITSINDDVTVYATFVGNYDATRDKSTTSTSIEHGDISVGGVSIKDDNVAKIGSIVNAVAKPDAGYRLEKIRWMKVTDGQMKVRNMATSETVVEVAGWNELKYDGADPVIYNSANGEYVATINGLKSDIYMTGSFTAKKDIGTTEVTVVFNGPGEQQYIGGEAVIPPTGSYSVTFDGLPQTEGVDYTIEWSENYNTTDSPKATIKATATNELYKGTKVIDNAFTIVAPPTGDYETSYSSDFTYDGNAKELTDLTVYKVTNKGQANEDKTLMTSGTGDGQYQVTYVNNTNAGTATAKIEIHGTSGGTLIRTFNIKPEPITVTASAQTVTYGTSIAATGTLATAATLVAGHLLASANFAQTHKDVGTHTGDIDVTGAKIKDGSNNDVTSNYSITYVKGDLTINTKELTITPIARTLEYGDALPTDDNALTALYTVDGLAYGESLTAGPTGYSVKQGSTAVTLQQSTPVGAYKLTLSEATASDNYTVAYAEGDLTITQYDLSKATVTVTGAEKPYDGTAKTATSVVVKKGDFVIPAENYDVKYAGGASQTAPGTYTITAVAKGTNVTGAATAETPLVIGKYDLTGDLVTATVDDQTFTGSQIRPTTFSTLTINGADITTTDYDIISYGTNINVGTGTLTIRAKDNSGMLKGDRTVTFNIVAADLSSQTASVAYADYVMAGSSTDTHQLKLNGEKTEVSTTLINGQTVSLASNSLVVKLKLPGGSANTTALSPDDYDVYFQKDTEDPIASIPANAIGVYKVVVKGKTNTTTETTNTTNYYVTDLKVNVKLAVTLANRTWTTYYDERFSLQLPTGFNAYYVPTAGITAATTNTPASVNTTSVGFIPRGVPVLIERTNTAPEGTVFELEEDITNAIPTGIYSNFVGVPSTGVMPDATPTYILMNDAFVGYEPGTVIGAHRAFLTTAPSAARMVISIGGGTTGLEAVDVDTTDSERWYDLQGNRIAKPTRKGLYIKDGRKVVVK